ncbi:hypothetical protein QAD02_019029 [Eretmocerus hayati]|uniref:Uncharacterized protein n=1 Tax=Eretmocerus hayati TaxID=131215 RepID=A0ACC2PIG3_9HYME|nr:hypothetical protein QAD02_019029 [Eretmocerus hayati]
MEKNQLETQQALEAAFQTMKERCQQLEAKLITVEEENISLQRQQEKNDLIPMIKLNETDKNILNLQEKIVELKRQNARLAHHTSMVSTENQQLWRRLAQFIKGNEPSKNVSVLNKSYLNIPLVTNKSESDSDRFLKIDNIEKYHELDNVPLQVTPSKLLGKSDSNRTFSEDCADTSVKDIGFTYPEDISADPTDNTKYINIKMIQMREALLLQQTKLAKTLQNFRNREKNVKCDRCRNNSQRLMCQTGTQIDSDCSWRKNSATQTSKSSATLPETTEDDVCPLCGLVFKSVSFDIFHEHVINHFTKENSNEFELIT